MSDILTITGTLLEIYPEQTFPSGFSKREFVVQTDGRYPQPVKFELTKERCARLDSFQVGDPVKVNFDVRGNEYEGRYFVNLVCWKISPRDEMQSAASARQPAPVQGGRFGSGVYEDDEVPY